MLKWKKIEDHADYFVMQCPNCKEIQRLGRHKGKLAGQSVSAILEDNNGNQVAVNSKGRKVDNVYAKDPRGWKRAGKKIHHIDEHNKKVNYP